MSDILTRMRGSSILYSTNFTSINEFYLKSDFINKAYNYYIKKGFYNIISSEIVNLLISSFIIFFLIFLYKCVDFAGLIDVDEDREPLSNYIHWDRYFELNWIIWMLIVFYLIFTIFKIINIIDNIIINKKIRYFFNNTLDLQDNELISMSWEDIISIIKKQYIDDNINVYYISNRINVKDNYMTAMIDKNIMELNNLTDLMEWNIGFCIINKIFNDESKIKQTLFEEPSIYIDGIKWRLKFIAFLNFIFMPFILIFILFYNIFAYGEKFYNKPTLLSSYTWTNIGKWKIRDYNELYHNLYERLEKAEKPAKEYCNQFHNKILDTLSNFILFLSNSLFLVLVLLSLINEQIIINLYISHDRSVIWYMGILATISTLCKSVISNKIVFYPKNKLKDVKNIIEYIPENWIENAHKVDIKKKFNTLYENKILNISKNILFILIVPFQLYRLSYNVDNIVNFLISSSYKHEKLGYVCKYSLFDNINNITDSKTIQSYNNFRKININYNIFNENTL